MDALHQIFVAPFQEFAFMRRALVASLGLSLGCAPMGVFLILRRMSLVGDAMSHAILPGAAIGYVAAGLSLGAMALGGFIAGLFTALAAGIVARTTPLREDASFAAFYLISLAAGVLIVSLHGSSVDLMHVLFGSILAVDDAALLTVAGITTVTIVALAVLFRPLVIECFDPEFLRAVGGPSAAIHILFSVLVVINLVAAFHALGTLMAVGMMMLPAAAARFWARQVFGLLASASGIAAIASVVGLVASYSLDAPTGPTIVLVAGVIYIASILFGTQGGVIWRWFAWRHLEA
jgi:zinc/manganese transport system permease protein